VYGESLSLIDHTILLTRANRDTVASVGLLMPQTLPFVSNDTIKHFRHAISLDEHRKRFDITLWSPDEEVTGPRNPSYTHGRDASVLEVWFAGCHSGTFIHDRVDLFLI
jgi:uncharacterized protein (DUF2235 family)